MPVPFGFSLGDFLTGIQTIAHVLESLKDSGGSSQKFRELVRTLHTFETVLRRIHLTAEERLASHPDTSSFEAAQGSLVADLKRVVSEGRSHIDAILKKIDGYHKLLGSDCTLQTASLRHGATSVKAVVAKIKWHVLRDDDVVVWQRELEMRNNSLTSMFLILSFRDISANYQQILGHSIAHADRFQLIESRFDAIDTQLKQQLSEMTLSTNHAASTNENYVAIAERICTQLDEIRGPLQEWRENHATQSQQLESRWCQEIASELRSLRDAQQTFEAQAEKFELLLDLERRLRASKANEARLLQMVDDTKTSFMSQMSQLLPRNAIATQLISFEDSLGNICHFDIQYVPDFDTFHEHIAHRFKHLLGYESHFIRRKQYALFDATTGERIPLIGGQRAFFKPGQSVVMSMCAAITGIRTSSLCPACNKIGGELSETEVTCVHCGCSYRRIEEVDDMGELTNIERNNATQVEGPENIRKYKHLSLVKRLDNLPSATSPTDVAEVTPTTTIDIQNVEMIGAGGSNADSFNTLLQQIIEGMQRDLTEDLEMQKALAFWNPLEAMDPRDAIC